MRFRSLVSRRGFLGLAGIGLLGGAAAGVYASCIEPHWVEVVRLDLPVEGLPPALEGQTLVQLSDIHVGPRVDDNYLIASFGLVNEMEPAIVAITGDFMTCHGTEQVDHALQVLEHLHPGRLGTVAVLGNHDYRRDARGGADSATRLARGLRDQGVTVLRNERHTQAGLTFVGVDDLWRGTFDPRRALAGLSAHEPVVALCHNPDGVDQPGWGGFRGWILAGHTHGGQCKPPFLPPPLLPVKNRRYVAGEIDLGDGRRMYINRALGHLRRVRFNVRPEITAFRLTRAARAGVRPA
jgi:predicted MPP superfamily phosphohydrolase